MWFCVLAFVFCGRMIAAALFGLCGLLADVRAVTLLFCGRMIADALFCECLALCGCHHRGTEMRAVASLPCCFLRVREDCFFPALHLVCPHYLGCGLLLLRPTVYCVQRRSSLTRRMGLCPKLCKGLCPLTPQASGARLDRALFNALSRSFRQLCSSRRQSVFPPAPSLARRTCILFSSVL